MPNYEYKAANAKGEASLGVIEAPDIDAALARLRASGLYPWGVVPTDEPVPERPKPEPVKPIDDGGPEFPESASGPYPNGEIVPGRPGMSLRAWLTGKALPIVAPGCYSKGDYVHASNFYSLAQDACALADAVIAALANKR